MDITTVHIKKIIGVLSDTLFLFIILLLKIPSTYQFLGIIPDTSNIKIKMKFLSLIGKADKYSKCCYPG